MPENLETNAIIFGTNLNSTPNQCENIGVEKKWKKVCPVCNKELVYSTKFSLVLSIKRNCICKRCARMGSKNPSFGSCGYWKGKVGPNKGIKVLDEFRQKMSKIVMGRKHSAESKRKMSILQMGKNTWSKGKIVSDVTKYKMRVRRIEDLRRKGIFPGSKISKNYNPDACQFINVLNEKRGWNLQHALNGGEVEIYGYFVDGYDKQRNIVFEYDEEHHNKKKEKDRMRQERIIKSIFPNEFWRYDEKDGMLREVINGEEVKCHKQ